jgi:large subunit ribosomal protein L22
MEVRATAKYVRVQPRKVRIIADEVRGKNCGHAAALLHHHTSKGARTLRKVLISAMANAAENHGLAPENLKIVTIMVDEGPRLKRMIAKAMGRGARILKKTSHITVIVGEGEPEVAVKPHGAKAKARPTFATKPGKGPKNSDPKPGTVPPPVEEPTVPPPVEEPEVPTTEPSAPAEEPTTNAAPAEATPVEASDAPEEGGSTTDAAAQAETTEEKA